MHKNILDLGRELRRSSFFNELSGPRPNFSTLEDFPLSGSGLCLDLGCGQGPHREVVESAGYRWVGMDIRPSSRISVRGDALRLPFSRGTFSAVLAWQALEHFPKFWMCLAEVHRVLKNGGRFLGSVSFLEPYHDASFYGFSELGLRYLLNDNGFVSIDIKPGISCFPLIMWTLFSRMGGGYVAGASLSFAGILLKVVNCLYPLAHDIGSSIAPTVFGSARKGYWFTRAPYEFAGHFSFSAYKG